MAFKVIMVQDNQQIMSYEADVYPAVGESILTDNIRLKVVGVTHKVYTDRGNGEWNFMKSIIVDVELEG